MRIIYTIFIVIIILSFPEHLLYGKIWTAQQFTHDGASISPRIDNGKVAWIGIHPTTHKLAIFCQDLVTGNTQIVTGDTSYPNIRSISFRDGMVCWRSQKDGQDVIYLWDGNRVQVIDQYEPGPFPYAGYPPSYGSLDPMIDHGQIVYAKWDGNDYEIYLWDGNRINQLTDNDTNDYEPQIAQGKVCFTAESGGDIRIRLWENGKIINAPYNGYKQEDSYIHKNIVTYCEYHPSPDFANTVYWDGNKALRIAYPGPDYEPAVGGDGSIEWTNWDWDSKKKIQYHPKALYFDGYKIFNILETEDTIKEPYSDGYNTVVERESNNRWDVYLLTYLKSSFHQGDTAGKAIGLLAEDNIGYLLCTKKLFILDVSDPNSILLKSSIDIPDTSTYFPGIAKKGDYLFLSEKDKGAMFSIDIRDVNNPSIIKSSDSPPGVIYGSCMVSDRILYTSDYDKGLGIIDLTDPSHPSLLGSRSFSHPIRSMVKVNNFLFCACPGYGIIMLDVADPLNPIEIGQCELPDGNMMDGFKTPLNLAIRYPFLFVAQGEQGVLVLDVKDVKNPKIIERINTTGFCCDISLYKDTLFAADGQDGMAIFDISDYRPEEIQDSDITLSVTPDRALAGDKVSLSASIDKRGYFEFEFQVSTENGQWKTIRPYSGDPNCSWVPSSFDIGSYEARVLVRNTGEEIEYRAMTTSGEKRIARKMTISHLTTTCPNLSKLSMQYMAIQGNYLYVASGWYGILIFDISDPHNPRYIKYHRLSSGTNAMEIAIKGNYLFFANREYGVEIMDISDPHNPLWIANYNTPGMATRLTIKDNLLFIGDKVDPQTGSSVICLDISDPYHPALLSSYAAGNSGVCWGVTVYGDYLFVAYDDHGIDVLDINQPDEMKLVSSISNFSPYRAFTNKIEIDNTIAFSVEGNSGIHSFDISNPLTIKPLGSASVPIGSTDVQNTPPLGIAIKDHKYAFVANGSDGIRVFDISTPSAMFEVSHYDTPNFAFNCLINGDCLYVADYDSIQVLDISDFCHGDAAQVQTRITPGLNLFCLPGWIDSFWNWRAASLLKYLNDQGIEIKKIVDYDPLQEKWQAGVWENGNFQGADFEILPAKSYLLYVSTQDTQLLSFTASELFTPYVLHKGVNFCNFPGNLGDYTSYDLLKELEESNCSDLATYQSIRGKWQGCYHFFGQPAGEKYQIQKNNCYVLEMMSDKSDWKPAAWK